MFKKLDKLVIRAFLGPFVAVFFVTLLVLVIQFFWLYIDDFVGKGLDTPLILEFIWYQSAVLVPLALPLAILLSSLMTFGNLGETFELVAIKAAGISLLRFMQPLFFVVLIIAGIAFLFSNYIIPVANLKSRTMLADIIYAKPSFDIREGVFYDKLTGFAIKIGQKEPNDSVIRDIIIYENSNSYQDNFIVARDGVMRISENKRFMEFVLRDGWRYEEKASLSSPTTDYIRLGFKEYKRQFDLSSFGLQKMTADSVNRQNAKMLSMRQLNMAIDSISRNTSLIKARVHSEVFSMLSFPKYMDTVWAPAPADTLAGEYEALIPDSIKNGLHQRVNNRLLSLKVSNEVAYSQYAEQQRNLRLHQIEWHRKITLSVACIVLFLIGAPLGSIIRKGGLGTPLVFAIVFFMLFYFSSTTGEKISKEGAVSPAFGMWMSTAFLFPIGAFLIVKALNDSQLFNKELYSRLIRRIMDKAGKKARPKH